MLNDMICIYTEVYQRLARGDICSYLWLRSMLQVVLLLLLVYWQWRDASEPFSAFGHTHAQHSRWQRYCWLQCFNSWLHWLIIAVKVQEAAGWKRSLWKKWAFAVISCISLVFQGLDTKCHRVEVRRSLSSCR